MSEAVARPVPPLPTLASLDDDRIAGAHPGVLLPRMLATARDRLEWVAGQLAEQCERDGLSGVVGRTRGVTPQGETVELGEEIRALVALEERERDRVASLAQQIARLGLDSGQALRDAANNAVFVMFALLGELGLDEKEPVVVRAMQRAAMAARQRLGHDEFAPDSMGAPLSPQERAALFRAGLAVAERESAEAAAVTGGESGGPRPVG